MKLGGKNWKCLPRMSEIEFRGKEMYGKKWIYGHFWNDGFDDYIIVNEERIKGCTYIPILHPIISGTGGQYTGLKDRNGVKIFEKDIVEDTFMNIGVIAYSDHFLDWRIVFFNGRLNLLDEYGARMFEWVYPKIMLKIIGNIHDNPELINRE
jgi:uncharacterized phage protein (TIGR01671 family)